MSEPCIKLAERQARRVVLSQAIEIADFEGKLLNDIERDQFDLRAILVGGKNPSIPITGSARKVAKEWPVEHCPPNPTSPLTSVHQGSQPFLPKPENLRCRT